MVVKQLQDLEAKMIESVEVSGSPSGMANYFGSVRRNVCPVITDHECKGTGRPE